MSRIIRKALISVGIATAVVTGSVVVDTAAAPPAKAAADLVFNDSLASGAPIYFTDLVGTKRILYPGQSNGGRYGIYQAARVYAPSTNCISFTVYHSNGTRDYYFITPGTSIPARDGDSVHGRTTPCSK